MLYNFNKDGKINKFHNPKGKSYPKNYGLTTSSQLSLLLSKTKAAYPT